MPINGLVLKKNATGATITAGTDITFESDGTDVKNGVHVTDIGESNFLVRTNITFKTRNPSVQPDGSYSKAKRNATIVVPKILTDGSVSFNLVRVETEIHPESSASEILNLHLLGAQYFTDPDLESFRNIGSIA